MSRAAGSANSLESLFGVKLSAGAVDAICQRASEALAGPHLQLHDWILDQAAVHVDETGWKTAGTGGRYGPRPPRRRRCSQIAEHCNREQLHAMIGSYPGIVISDRWNGYNHLDPSKRQVVLVTPPARLPPPLRRTRGAEDLRRARTRAHRPGVRRVARLPARASRPQTSSRPRSTRSRPNYERLLEHAARKSKRTRWHRRFANNLLKIWPALWTFATIDGSRADQQPR